MKHRITTILSLCLLLAPMAQGQDENFLDLTRIKPPQKEKLRGWGAAGPDEGRGLLKLTLRALDRRSCQVGEETIYEVILENVSENVLVIPWSLDWEQVEGDREEPPPGYLAAYLTLTVHDEVIGEVSLKGKALYGSELLPGSLKNLEPSETVRIRASSRWEFTENEETRRIMFQLPHIFEVRAKWSSLYHPTASVSVISTNSLSVELKRE